MRDRRPPHALVSVLGWLCSGVGLAPVGVVPWEYNSEEGEIRKGMAMHMTCF